MPSRLRWQHSIRQYQRQRGNNRCNTTNLACVLANNNFAVILRLNKSVNNFADAIGCQTKSVHYTRRRITNWQCQSPPTAPSNDLKILVMSRFPKASGCHVIGSDAAHCCWQATVQRQRRQALQASLRQRQVFTSSSLSASTNPLKPPTTAPAAVATKDNGPKYL